LADPDPSAAGGSTPRRLFVYNGGFLTQGRVRRILELSGYDIRLGAPGDGDMVGVWGQSPTSPRGEAVAARTNAPILRVEDAFLRSVRPGRDRGGPPLGLCLDTRGVHFDPSRPSDLETLLATAALDDTALLNRARDGIARLKRSDLSKYTAYDPDTPLPGPGYVLVIDQTEGDASVKASRGDRNAFLEMLYYAREEHPAATIIVKGHPETAAGHRPGHLTGADLSDNMILRADPVSPWKLLDGAIAVYVHSSQMGFEAILAGHKPRVFGQPFYAGWGLTDDRAPVDRRQRNLTRAQLFAGAMLLYPRWYDPFTDRLCDFETAVAAFEADTRAWRDDHRGWVATGISLWKRPHMRAIFGTGPRLTFADSLAKAEARAKAEGKRLMIWAGKATPDLATPGITRVEDGFLRSRGLGADLVPPLSLVLDDTGIYYDPTRESRLDRLIAAATALDDTALRRAEALMAALRASGVSKYNLSGKAPTEPTPALLVAGQVEDDASIRLGTGEVATNRALLAAARAANPEARILYKPHPDVEAGLRPGAVPDAADFADAILADCTANAAIDAASEVWTMTSTLGFEALIRGRPVTCLGMPFYAGWGLTTDTMPAPAHRTARPTLPALVHAVLIDYPRYHDPVTGRPCPPETALARLADGEIPRRGPALRLLAKLQGALASWPFWR
jgi:capsular polysaccharide export protein